MNRLAVYQTDQASCFASDGHQIPCAGTGQDGEIRAGRSWPVSRFTLEGQLVLDRLTSLVWPQDAALTELPLTWQEACDWILQINMERLEGFSDWRLPARPELSSLLSHAQINPALPTDHPFKKVFPGYYWTATPCSRFPHQAWYVHLGGGRVFRGMRHGSYMVWPVRNSPDRQPKVATVLAGEERFRSCDAIVYDRLTGLRWSTPVLCGRETVTWQAALDRVTELNRERALGYGDWRLPNVRELESLIDLRSHSPAISPDNPFEDLGDGYWSSTTSVYDAAYAWVIYMQDGEVGVGFKAKPEFYEMVVR
jgi:hypothetical protein